MDGGAPADLVGLSPFRRGTGPRSFEGMRFAKLAPLLVLAALLYAPAGSATSLTPNATFYVPLPIPISLTSNWADTAAVAASPDGNLVYVTDEQGSELWEFASDHPHPPPLLSSTSPPPPPPPGAWTIGNFACAAGALDEPLFIPELDLAPGRPRRPGPLAAWCSASCSRCCRSRSGSGCTCCCARRALTRDARDVLGDRLDLRRIELTAEGGHAAAAVRHLLHHHLLRGLEVVEIRLDLAAGVRGGERVARGAVLPRRAPRHLPCLAWTWPEGARRNRRRA